MTNNPNSNIDADEGNLDAKIIETALERFDFALKADTEIRKEATDDAKFANGDQWPADVLKERLADDRPCITINRMPAIIHQITNDQRMNRPAIRVSPVDDKADIKTAKAIQGLVRYIERSSNADVAYSTAFDSQVRASFGYFRIVTEYSDPMSFDLDIRIKRIPDRNTCLLDPTFKEIDGSDAEWGFVFEDLTHDEFKVAYPNAKLSDSADWKTHTEIPNAWVTEDTVRIAEYFFKEYRETTICLLSDGSVIEEDKLPKAPGVLPFGDEGKPLRVLAKRKTQLPTVHWWKINGIEPVEKTIWPGKYIPIVPVLGEEQIIDGKRVLTSITRFAKDPARMYNYHKSNETETIALAPKAPWIGVEGQFEGFENQWRDSNKKNYAFLQYKAKTIGGMPAPPPQRNSFEPAVQAITQASMLSAQDIKDVSGVHGAALGEQGNEKSGKAIMGRVRQAQTSNFHFSDNLNKSIRHGGRIIVDLIPKIYNQERASIILGEDGTEELIWLNKEFDYNGEKVHHRLNIGKYDVSIDTGPNFETKRQEAAESMLDFTRSLPAQAGAIADLLAKNLDWPGAQEIAERLRKMLPPGVVDDKNAPQIPPEAKAQMDQMSAMIDTMTQQLNELKQEKELKLREFEHEITLKAMDNETKAAIELAKLQSNEAIIGLQQQIKELDMIVKMQMQMQKQTQAQDYEQVLNGAGLEQAVTPIDQQQPTGGLTPEPSMGELP